MTSGPAETDALVLVDDGRRWLRLTRPHAVLVADSPGDVPLLLQEVEQQTRARGCHAVGYLTYEAGAAYGLRVGQADPRLPLAAFALFPSGIVSTSNSPASGTSPAVGHPRPTWDRASYVERFDRIKRHIAEGDTYQVNCTFALEAPFHGEPRELFGALVRSQRGRYAAWLRLGEIGICSASPELFVCRRGHRLVSRPMKGTARRGRTTAEDVAAVEALRRSRKERAENVMIVDMVRNDLGRIARIGSVEVVRLFEAEKYPTVWQMTSEVACDSTASLGEIMAAMFPSASITGAPKARTMEIIAELEDRPRGIYTGTVGYVAPNGDATFNVAIRTALVDTARESLTFGVGSGVVWDSDAAAEYAECLLKGGVLTATAPECELLETLAWAPDGGYAVLDGHLKRLAQSARYFDIAYQETAVRAALDRAVAGASSPQRVRLLVSENGAARTESAPLVPTVDPVRVRLAQTPVDSADRFLFHKTTRRAVYESRLEADVDDVLLWNERGELTESTIANIVVELDGALVTPPVEAGLLAGSFRAGLVDDGKVVERTVPVADLERATGLWLVNSVRGWRRAVVVERAARSAR
jgi:para-aminobenzoate synthetase/4-amino-4-deoxychorismate lyase